MICIFNLKDNITIDCQYTSIPQGILKIGWSDPNLKNVQIKNSTKIIITETTLNNIGNYSCSVNNIVQGNVLYSSLVFDLRLEGTFNYNYNNKLDPVIQFFCIPLV